MPVDAIDAVVEATDQYPLVAIGEFHLMQEWHDFMAELLRRRDFTDNVDDLVVEFGNALYQDVADRFILDLEAVPFPELSQMWRNTLGGGVLWDAPVYEQFFRTVRSVNEALPRDERVRVLLGDPDIDYSQVQSAVDSAELDREHERDAFYANVVEREVIAQGRRGVLISGADHLRRGVHSNIGPQPNVATLLAREHAAELFIFYPLPYLHDERVADRVEAALEVWPRPSAALLDDTWLGAQELQFRALEPDSTFGEQVDAVIWFGPRDVLTASRPDPAIYEDGDYASELRRRSRIYSEYFDEPVYYIADGERLAAAGPRLYEEPQQSGG